MIDAEEWLHAFVLPLIAGGDVRVSTVIGQRELDELLAASLDSTQQGARVAEARYAVSSELLLHPGAPELDAEAITLAAAVQNLLFLSHPDATGAFVRRSRLKQVVDWTCHQLARLEPPDGLRTLAARHTMLHHLFDLGRDDVRVSFWAGRREFKGAEPPARLLKWSTVRRVREERWRVAFLTEAVADPGQRAIVFALLQASPLTDLLDPLRLDPPLDLKPLSRWLAEPQLARAVADRYLTLGFAQLAGPLTAAMLTLCNARHALPETRRWTRFFCHLHLLALLAASGQTLLPELQAIAVGQPAARDFFGLFAAAQRLGVGRPDDLARDESLVKRVDAYAAACATVCGPQRVAELEGLLARGVQQVLLSS